MFKSGWVRLWLVSSVAVMMVTLAWAAYYVWGVDECRRVITITVSSTASPKEQAAAEDVKRELLGQPICGSQSKLNAMLNLDWLASEGVVTQVALDWLAPGGWTSETSLAIDILNGKAATADAFVTNTAKHVHQARLKTAWPMVLLVVALCFAGLLLGFAAKWVRQGTK